MVSVTCVNMSLSYMQLMFHSFIKGNISTFVLFVPDINILMFIKV